MQRVQWNGMQPNDLIRELEAAKREARLQAQQLLVAAGVRMNAPLRRLLSGEVVDNELEVESAEAAQ
jgi:hypothetical protein